MTIIIVLVILIFVLGIGKLFFRIFMLSALRKKNTYNFMKTEADISAETIRAMRDVPEFSELSEVELRKKLRFLNIWMRVKKIGTPLPAVVGFTMLIILGVRQESFSGMEIVYEIIAPVVLTEVVLIGLLLLAHMRIRKLKDFMGAAIVLPVLKEIFEVRAYQPNGHLPSGLISSAGLVDGWTDIEGSDYIEGSYKGINILYSDLHLQHIEESYDDGKKTVSCATVFKGQWLICDFGRELAASIRLIERIGGIKRQRTIAAGKSDIETENIEFNKKYRIITGDGHTAFYLLTPHFMERLVATDEAANASTRFCFQDGKVHIALYSGCDSFELKGVKLADMESVRHKFRSDLKYMTDIMDELLLNVNLFGSSIT